jgi:hypothetical protein
MCIYTCNTVLIGGGTTGALVASATAPAAGQQQHFIARVRASAGANDSFKAATVWTLQVYNQSLKHQQLRNCALHCIVVIGQAPKLAVGMALSVVVIVATLLWLISGSSSTHLHYCTCALHKLLPR